MCGAMSGMMGNLMSTGMMGMMFLSPLLFIVVFALLTYFVIRSLMRKNKVVDHPLMILKERFAKGEINEEQKMELLEKQNQQLVKEIGELKQKNVV